VPRQIRWNDPQKELRVLKVVVAREYVKRGHRIKADFFHLLNLQTSKLLELNRMEDTTNFYLKQEEPNRSCFLAMREIVRKSDSEIVETIKYGSPCFVYRGRAFCYLWKDKKTNEPYFLLVEGKRLSNPALEAGDRKRMKVLRVDPNQDLEVTTIISVLQEGLDLYRNGVIKTK
jgi:hypothetical protein